MVCDEPTSALDLSVQSQVLNLMLDLKDRFDMTYLFISHNLNVVYHFCDDIMVIYLGEIVERGSAKDIYETPKHPYTKLLIDSIPVTHPKYREIKESVAEAHPLAEHSEGCQFYDRCNKRLAVCKSNHPVETIVSENHYVCCHIYNHSFRYAQGTKRHETEKP